MSFRSQLSTRKHVPDLHLLPQTRNSRGCCVGLPQIIQRVLSQEESSQLSVRPPCLLRCKAKARPSERAPVPSPSNSS
ncbi:unnamed protein product, partial [Iphiclides podalirius]